MTLGLPISPGYLQALQVPLLRGRYLEPRDHLQRTSAVVISAEAARRFFPGEDPVGRRLVQDAAQWTPFTVVGVVGDVQHEDPRKAHVPFVYLPVLGDFAPFERGAVTYAVRVSGTPLALVETIRREMAALRPDIPMAHVETQSALVARSTAQLRFALWLLAVAAGAALALSAAALRWRDGCYSRCYSRSGPPIRLLTPPCCAVCRWRRCWPSTCRRAGRRGSIRPRS